jgi:hypothetical protein
MLLWLVELLPPTLLTRGCKRERRYSIGNSKYTIMTATTCIHRILVGSFVHHIRVRVSLGSLCKVTRR